MRGHLYGLGRPLALITLLVAAGCAVLFPLAQFTDRVPDDIALKAVQASAFTLAVLLLRVGFDPAVRQAMGEEWQAVFATKAGRPGWSGPFDPKWGAGALPVLRLVLLCEFMAGVIMSGAGRSPPPVLIAFIGVALCILLTLAKLKEQRPADAEKTAAP